jgi:hypothetical protein
MADNFRFEIPENCRQFAEGSSDERRRVAKRFVEEFVKTVAPPSRDDSDRAWTQSIRKRLIEIRPEYCCASPCDPCKAKGEYLVDYTWEEENNGRRVLLACESEWGSGRNGTTNWAPVEHDFEKLLAVKAPFKILIFSSCCKSSELKPNPEVDFSIEYAKKRLKESLENYWHHLPGEVYIYIDFPATGEKDGPGIFRSFVWIAEKYGKADVKFEDGPNGDLVRSCWPSED